MAYDSTTGGLTQVSSVPFTGAYLQSGSVLGVPWTAFAWDASGTGLFVQTQGYYFNAANGSLVSLAGANPIQSSNVNTVLIGH